jgi:hypothetical protein
MNPRLRVEVGRQANFEYEVPPVEEEEAVWLGRGAFCKIRMADTQLSRRHCQFTYQNGVLYVEDLGSRNGTRVNGELIDGRVQLEDGDSVVVGSHELRVILAKPASSASAVELPELGTAEAEAEANGQMQALVGKDFAGYQLQDIIFNGSTCCIYRARDAAGQRTVAIKVLKPLARISVEDQNRFIRGAKSSAGLHHPCFVQVFKGGRFEDRHYIAMEFVRGKSLADVVQARGGPLEVQTALKIARQLLEALQYAYEHEVVFRAVRPDNIIIGDGLSVKLVDYDLVKPLTGRQEAQVTRVMDGSLTVDPSFAAPELIAYPVVADQKADIFGVGAVLYFMLTGQPPFGARLPASKPTSAFDRVVTDPRSINPAVPESLCQIMRQSMSDYERFSSPQDMLAALDKAAAEL